MNTRQKMYVLVRKDLDETYRIVQGSHAVAELSLRGDTESFKSWNNGTIVFLAVQNEQTLNLWSLKLSDKNKVFVKWHEPDLNGQMTAIACIDEGEVFKKLNLAK